MTDELAARIRLHQANIDRFILQLQSATSPAEKQQIERRIDEEREAIEALSATAGSAFPGPHSLL